MSDNKASSKIVKCVCGKDSNTVCKNCKKQICEDCGTDTVDGFLCGSYTEWGCARKYTTCDECLDDKAIHESNMNICEMCGNSICDDCFSEHDCS